MEKSSSVTDFPTEIVEEGRVKLLVPKLRAFVKSPSEYAPSKAPVFYNPVMELNRDIAVLALQAYQMKVNREITVCEPLASCGIRGVRFAVEVRGVKKVVMNDINEKAIRLAKHNVQLNRLDKCCVIRNEDANLLLSRHGAPRKRFDSVDIDPFGSPVSYLDSAIRALRNGGLLALTATDMAPLCGVHPKACVRKYGGKPLRTEYCHELAVRLVAGCLVSTAARHEVGINILFSHSADHYVRTYASIEYGAKKADESVRKMGYMLHCFRCFHREPAFVPSLFGRSATCNECGERLSYAGPLWLGRIFDGEFCSHMEREAERRTLRLGERIRKILTLTKIEADAPISYYVVDELCDLLGLPVPPVKRVSDALKKKGFDAYFTHFTPKGIRSNAPAKKIGEIVRRVAYERRQVLNNVT